MLYANPYVRTLTWKPSIHVLQAPISLAGAKITVTGLEVERIMWAGFAER